MNDIIYSAPKCKNVFHTSDPVELTQKFTDLWILIIRNQELNMNMVTLKNNVLRKDSKVI